GIAQEKICFVGNVMIDTLVRLLPEARRSVPASTPERFALVTLHRPSNVDDPQWLREAMQTLAEISRELPVIFAVHPRTRERLREGRIATQGKGSLQLVEPRPYIEFIGLLTRAAMAITDSGGIQEETTFLGVPCLTLRENTERPITITQGTNRLVGRDLRALREGLREMLKDTAQPRPLPPLWDGHAAARIARILVESGSRARGSNA